MRHSSFFRFSVMTVIWFYLCTFAQAGQVITANDKSWAKKAIQQEGELGAISTSNSIAVLYFNNKTGRHKLDPLQKGLAVMLITDLAKVDQLQVVERVRMQALLDEMELGGSGLVDVSTAPKVGKLLGAYYVASGDIADSKIKDIELDPYLLDVPFEILTRKTIADGNLNELFKLEKQVLFDLIDQMKISLSPAKRAELEKPMSTSMAALLALFIGIDHSDKGQYVEAAKMYEQALAEDPHLALAKSSLQELKGMGLISSGEAGAAGQQPPVVPAAEEGTSVGTIIGVGVALAAVGAGVAVAMGSSSGDDDNSSSSQGEVGTTSSVNPDNNISINVSSYPEPKATIHCSKGSIGFSFSQSMNHDFGFIDAKPAGLVTSRKWSGNTYVISWAHGYDYCWNGSAVSYDLTVTLNEFQDVSGNPLATTTFDYTVSDQ